jgi:hypothetical protein
MAASHRMLDLKQGQTPGNHHENNDETPMLMQKVGRMMTSIIVRQRACSRMTKKVNGKRGAAMSTSPMPDEMSIGAFLAWNDGIETQYELVDGQVMPLPVFDDTHGRIVDNIATRLKKDLAGKRPDARLRRDVPIVVPHEETVLRVPLAVLLPHPTPWRRHRPHHRRCSA